MSPRAGNCPRRRKVTTCLIIERRLENIKDVSIERTPEHIVHLRTYRRPDRQWFGNEQVRSLALYEIQGAVRQQLEKSSITTL